MTFDDDYIQLRLSSGPLRIACKEVGIDWPPPERIAIVGGPLSVPIFRRVSFSQLTDDERQGLTHVCRGAEYVHHPGADARLKAYVRKLDETAGAVITITGRKRMN
jgi:hypothetical protein